MRQCCSVSSSCTMHVASAAWHARSRIWFVCRHLQGQATHRRNCLGDTGVGREGPPCLGLLAMPINRTCTWTPIASVGCFMGPGRDSSTLYASLSAVYAPLGHFLKLFMATAGWGRREQRAEGREGTSHRPTQGKSRPTVGSQRPYNHNSHGSRDSRHDSVANHFAGFIHSTLRGCLFYRVLFLMHNFQSTRVDVGNTMRGF